MIRNDFLVCNISINFLLFFLFIYYMYLVIFKNVDFNLLYLYIYYNMVYFILFVKCEI